MKNIKASQAGFTLVEMLVSVGITTIILVGMSNFFSGILRSTLVGQERATNVQGQFVVNEILRAKLQEVEGLVGNYGTSAVVVNDLAAGGMPFTYVGQHTDRMVFRDFLIFNGMVGTTPSTDSPVDNPGGVTFIAPNYYVTAPIENKVYICNPAPLNSSVCSDLVINNTSLVQPIDIVASDDGQTLFISSAESNEIVVVDVSTQDGSVLNVPGLSFPTGLAYYQDGDGTNYLFVSDTGNNLVKRIELDTTPQNEPVAITVTVGSGDNEDCDVSANYCKLNFPTGLHVDSGNLYIADSGNDRILKVSEPSVLLGTGGDYTFSYSLGAFHKLDKITLSNATLSTGPYMAQDGMPDGSKLIGQGVDYDNSTLTFTSPTSASQPSVYEFDACLTGSNFFYLDAMPVGQNFWAGDKVVVEITPGNYDDYTIASVDSNIDCDSGAGNDPRNRINTVEALSSVTVGDTIWFSAPFNVQMKLQNVNFSASGFQPVEIRTYDVEDPATEVELDTVVVRVGDGVLGSEEDIIEELVTGLNFPTGISTGPDPQLKVADSLAQSIRTYNKNNGTPTGSVAFTPFTGATFTSFDHVSDFTIQGLSFDTLNGGKLLEVTIEADIGNGDTKTYIIDASLP